MTKRSRKRTPPEVRFWKRVVKAGPDDCWLIDGNDASDNYGKLKVDGRMVRAHVFSYELHKGPVSPNMVVRHTCDVKRCVNPKHLIEGTHADNMRDAIERGRMWHPVGDACHNIKLTSERKEEARRLYATGLYTHEQLAKLFEVSRIVLGPCLKDVELPPNVKRQGKVRKK